MTLVIKPVFIAFVKRKTRLIVEAAFGFLFGLRGLVKALEHAVVTFAALLTKPELTLAAYPVKLVIILAIFPAKLKLTLDSFQIKLDS